MDKKTWLKKHPDPKQFGDELNPAAQTEYEIDWKREFSLIMEAYTRVPTAVVDSSGDDHLKDLLRNTW